MAIDLDGAVALVTGGANGIGAAAVTAFGGLDVAARERAVDTGKVICN